MQGSLTPLTATTPRGNPALCAGRRVGDEGLSPPNPLLPQQRLEGLARLHPQLRSTEAAEALGLEQMRLEGEEASETGVAQGGERLSPLGVARAGDHDFA